MTAMTSPAIAATNAPEQALPRPPALSSAPAVQLDVQGVTRIFPGARGKPPTQALRPINLQVRENDFITILGPSGCGKSTLLRIIAGLDFPTEGQVLLEGRPVRGPGADRGMVFQSYTLFPWLTVEQNIRFGLRERGLSAAEQKEKSDFFIDKVGLRGFERHWPRQLSGGMQQRTAIARALANDPKMLLLDEPFGALDNQTRVLMQELLLGIWEQAQKTVLFVTHDIDEAIFMASRVAVFSARPGRWNSNCPLEVLLRAACSCRGGVVTTCVKAACPARADSTNCASACMPPAWAGSAADRLAAKAAEARMSVRKVFMAGVELGASGQVPARSRAGGKRAKGGSKATAPGHAAGGQGRLR